MAGQSLGRLRRFIRGPELRCSFSHAGEARERLCPNAVFVSPDFTPYRVGSRSVREIFKRHTDLTEPLSLDEAYLDVTENKTGLAATTLAVRTIHQQIRQELNLTASAGVAPNKFLAKLASGWRNPIGCLSSNLRT